MGRPNRNIMHVLQRYTSEYKEEVLSRSERSWRPQEAKVMAADGENRVETQKEQDTLIHDDA